MKFWRIFLAVAKKEWLQLRRDRLTAALLVSVPLAQVLLFGFAIELAPRHWPGVWVTESVPASQPGDTGGNADLDQKITEAMLQRFAASGWLQLPATPMEASTARAALVSGTARFVLHWPSKPSQYVLRGASIPLGIEADYSDPYVPAAVAMLTRALRDEADAGAASNSRRPAADPLQLEVQPRFVLEQGSGAYLVPALSGVILTLTLTLIAAFALVREQERGTWEALRSTPAGSGVIVLGKLLPYAGLGLLLFALLQAIAHLLFGTTWASPVQWLAALCFMLGQLGLGACLSLLARTQMQAMQLGVFFYLPSILLSGFMFPFHAMPAWARGLGELLPLTHFLRVLRADLFRDAETATLLSLGWPITVFAALMLSLAIAGYRGRMA